MNYYKEIKEYIKKNEVNKKARIIQENNDILYNYWNIGKLIIEAQGGEARAKYGNELIKEWAEEFTKSYGKGYDYTNLSRFRQLYLTFPILGPVAQLSWTILVKILPIKDENKRNYYINLCIERNLSKRDLIKEIKNNSYEILISKPKNIKIIFPKKNYSLIENIRNPIIIETENKITNEKELEIVILAQLKHFFNQLGTGFTYVDNQYKISQNSKNYYIDILLFNIKLNCYVVVELKVRELKKEDKAQIEFYMDLVDKQVKESFHNKTIGIIISKEQDKYIASFVSNDKIIPLTYITNNY